MLDKETMSKQKYIYYVYDSDRTVHIEKYPIIYINGDYVYFKRARKNTLSYVYTSYVKDSLADVFNKDYKLIYEKDRYFWNPVENPEEVVSALKKESDERRIKANKSWAERDLEAAKRNYERAQEKYNLWLEVSSKKGID